MRWWKTNRINQSKSKDDIAVDVEEELVSRGKALVAILLEYDKKYDVREVLSDLLGTMDNPDSVRAVMLAAIERGCSAIVARGPGREERAERTADIITLCAQMGADVELPAFELESARVIEPYVPSDYVNLLHQIGWVRYDTNSGPSMLPGECHDAVMDALIAAGANWEKTLGGQDTAAGTIRLAIECNPIVRCARLMEHAKEHVNQTVERAPRAARRPLL